MAMPKTEEVKRIEKLLNFIPESITPIVGVILEHRETLELALQEYPDWEPTGKSACVSILMAVGFAIANAMHDQDDDKITARLAAIGAKAVAWRAQYDQMDKLTYEFLQDHPPTEE